MTTTLVPDENISCPTGPWVDAYAAIVKRNGDLERHVKSLKDELVTYAEVIEQLQAENDNLRLKLNGGKPDNVYVNPNDPAVRKWWIEQYGMHKIDAIKHYRAETNVELRIAKEFVEAVGL
jgi:ribosomal protein L7/L12